MPTSDSSESGRLGEAVVDETMTKLTNGVSQLPNLRGVQLRSVLCYESKGPCRRDELPEPSLRKRFHLKGWVVEVVRVMGVYKRLGIQLFPYLAVILRVTTRWCRESRSGWKRFQSSVSPFGRWLTRLVASSASKKPPLANV